MARRTIDMTGKTIGRLTVIGAASREESRSGKGAAWVCQCECGNRKVVRGGFLRDGTTVSCGCLAKELLSARSKTHGMRHTRTYKTWTGMVQRCDNPNSPVWEWYGARGVWVCDAWRKFDAFLADMGERPPGMTLDRIDNNGGYCKENCRWATKREQSVNRRGVKLIEFNGRTLCINEWARELGIPKGSLASRLRSGWALEDALSTEKWTRWHQPQGGKRG